MRLVPYAGRQERNDLTFVATDLGFLIERDDYFGFDHHFFNRKFGMRAFALLGADDL